MLWVSYIFAWKTTEWFEWSNVKQVLPSPATISVNVISFTEARVTWAEVSHADFYEIEAQVRAKGGTPENLSIVVDSNTQATVTWNENLDFTDVHVKARIRAGRNIE